MLLLHDLFGQKGRSYPISNDVAIVAKTLRCVEKRASVKWRESQDPLRLYPSPFNPKDYPHPMVTGVSRKVVFRIRATSEITAWQNQPCKLDSSSPGFDNNYVLSPLSLI